MNPSDKRDKIEEDDGNLNEPNQQSYDQRWCRRHPFDRLMHFRESFFDDRRVSSTHSSCELHCLGAGFVFPETISTAAKKQTKKKIGKRGFVRWNHVWLILSMQSCEHGVSTKWKNKWRPKQKTNRFQSRGTVTTEEAILDLCLQIDDFPDSESSESFSSQKAEFVLMLVDPNVRMKIFQFYVRLKLCYFSFVEITDSSYFVKTVFLISYIVAGYAHNCTQLGDTSHLNWVFSSFVFDFNSFGH